MSVITYIFTVLKDDMSVEEEEEDDNGVRLIDFLCYVYVYVMVYNLILK